MNLIIDNMELRQLLDDAGRHVGASMYTRFPGGFDRKDDSRINFHCFQDATDGCHEARLHRIYSGGLFGKPCTRPKHFQYQGINEAVALARLVQFLYESVETSYPASGLMGRLGLKRRFRSHNKVGEKVLRHRELVHDGCDEPGCLLSYGAFDTADEREYNHGGRPGNVLVVDMILPDHLAMKIFGQIKRTPKFARELVEKVVIENLGISDNDWRRGQPISYDANPNPMRPPYGAWARNKGGYSKMAIQESGARISYGEDPFGRALEFREYSVIDVK